MGVLQRIWAEYHVPGRHALSAQALCCEGGLTLVPAMSASCALILRCSLCWRLQWAQPHTAASNAVQRACLNLQRQSDQRKLSPHLLQSCKPILWVGWYSAEMHQPSSSSTQFGLMSPGPSLHPHESGTSWNQLSAKSMHDPFILSHMIHAFSMS